MRVDLFERVQARRHAGQLLLARAHFARAPFVLDPCARQFRFARRHRHPRRIEAVLRATERFRRRYALPACAFELDPELTRLELQP
jgi:hypothetical protein